MRNKKIIQNGIIFFLLFPFLVLIYKLSITVKFDYQELFWALKNTTIQAFLSGFFSLLFGILLSFGVLSYQGIKKIKSTLDLFFLLPNFIPSLFIIIGLMNLIDPFPIGMTGIILAHVFINTGMVAIYLKDTINLKLGHSGELALVLGVSRLNYIFKVLLPQLKQDLLEVFFYVFSLSFASFAIPLVIGGGRGTNLEVLIYEKIRISLDWSSAIWISIVQSLILFGISFWTFKSKRYQQANTFNFKIISSKYLLYAFVVGYFLFFISFFKGIFEGVNFLSDFYLYKTELLRALFGTVFISIFVGIVVLVYLLLLTYVWEQNYFSKFLIGYIAPSSALTALSFFILGANEGVWVHLKIILALLIIYSSFAYRLGWNSVLHDLEHEKEKAKIFDADEALIFKKITFPIVIKRAFFIAGLCSFWTTGEFAICKILAQNDFTLAMITQTFISQYRIGLASILTLILLVIGVLIFSLFIGVGDVISKKIENSI